MRASTDVSKSGTPEAAPFESAPLMAPGLGRRMACWLYEGMLMFGVVFIAGYLFGTLTQTRHALAAVAPFGLSGGEMAVLTFGWIAVWALLSRFHPQQQFWHDVLAGTRLVSTRPAGN